MVDRTEEYRIYAKRVSFFSIMASAVSTSSLLVKRAFAYLGKRPLSESL